MPLPTSRLFSALNKNTLCIGRLLWACTSRLPTILLGMSHASNWHKRLGIKLTLNLQTWSISTITSKKDRISDAKAPQLYANELMSDMSLSQPSTPKTTNCIPAKARSLHKRCVGPCIETWGLASTCHVANLGEVKVCCGLHYKILAESCGCLHWKRVSSAQ